MLRRISDVGVRQLCAPSFCDLKSLSELSPFPAMPWADSLNGAQCQLQVHAWATSVALRKVASSQKLTTSVAGLTRTDRWSTMSVLGPIASAFALCDPKPSSAAARPRTDGFTDADERAS